MSENKINKILIIRLSALGDTIHTLPLAYAIKEKYPMVQLDWIVEDKAADFIINNPTQILILRNGAIRIVIMRLFYCFYTAACFGLCRA